MSDVSEDLEWFLEYIKASLSDAKLDPPDNQTISLTVDGNKKTISVKSFNTCISKLNSSLSGQDHQDQQDQQVHHHQLLQVLWQQIEKILMPSVPPLPFIQKSDLDNYHYKCLNTTELDINVEIPSSLHTLLTNATKTKQSCTTHRTKTVTKPDTSIPQLTGTFEEVVTLDDHPDEYVDAADFKAMQATKTQPSCTTHRIKSTISIKSATDFKDVTDVHVTDVNVLLAFIIVLKRYPENWKHLFFWDAWLAVTIQLHILGKPEYTTSEVFPSLWMDKNGIFLAETLVSPKKVQCLLLGQDPVAKSMLISKMRNATGIAFHNIGNENSSISNMNTYYNLDCSDDNPSKHCENGILMVNMIRCIFKDMKSMSENIFRKAWTAYTLKLANHFSDQTITSKIIVFCKSDYMPDLSFKYLPKVVSPQKFMDVHHPSRVWKDENKEDPDVKEVAEYLKTLQEQNRAPMLRAPHS